MEHKWRKWCGRFIIRIKFESRKGWTPVGGGTLAEALISTWRLLDGTIPDSYILYEQEDDEDKGRNLAGLALLLPRFALRCQDFMPRRDGPSTSGDQCTPYQPNLQRFATQKSLKTPKNQSALQASSQSGHRSNFRSVCKYNVTSKCNLQNRGIRSMQAWPGVSGEVWLLKGMLLINWSGTAL